MRLSVSVASVVVQDELMPKTRTRVRLEDGLKLDLNRLIRQGSVRPGARTGPLCIQWKRDGKVLAQVWITANMESNSHGWFGLQLGDVQQTILLRTMPRHFGGRQWFFVCPRAYRSVSILWKPSGAKEFASRQSWGRRVAYASQFQTPLDRACRGNAKIKARLIASPDPDAYDFPPKPKWMRSRTYQRYVEKHERYVAIIDQQFCKVAAAAARRAGI
jgi:hypothetical protein